LLGQTSPSEDVEETLTPVVDAPVPTLAQIEARLPDFTGLIQQRPPAYSALKVQGRRAYALARAGEEVILAARPVTIEQLQVLDYAYPRLELKLRCGSGTYVRSLGRDLAESLGTGAVMQNLVRTAIGPFTVESALDLETLDEAQLAQGLHAPLEGVAHLPQLRLDDLQLAELRHGRRISAEALLGTSVVPPEAVYAAVGTGGELVALVAEKRPGWLGPVCNFSQSS
jgi:tRNA pseudouridine55 synthase